MAQRAAEATERANTETEKGEEKSSDNVTSSVEDDASPVKDNSSDSQADQSVEKAAVESSDPVTVNGHAVEPVEQTLDKENTLTETEDSVTPASQAELTETVDGEAEFRSIGEETQSPKVNEEDSLTETEGIAIEVMINEVDKSDTDGVNGGINGYVDIPAKLAELDNQEVLTDIVLPKAIIANGIGEKDIAVNGLAETAVTANGIAEE